MQVREDGGSAPGEPPLLDSEADAGDMVSTLMRLVARLSENCRSLRLRADKCDSEYTRLQRRFDRKHQELEKWEKELREQQAALDQRARDVRQQRRKSKEPRPVRGCRLRSLSREHVTRAAAASPMRAEDTAQRRREVSAVRRTSSNSSVSSLRSSPRSSAADPRSRPARAWAPPPKVGREARPPAHRARSPAYRGTTPVRRAASPQRSYIASPKSRRTAAARSTSLRTSTTDAPVPRARRTPSKPPPKSRPAGPPKRLPGGQHRRPPVL
eukprot:TRINITY_DN20034_c0_g1_i1.p1 TRINITY_DN20034_c0_g1~~TRINITY_DN20034_c0_g1_i1.p1  ORF type:complete len:270 (+),score=29.57 TRINITY_DN20034_c0_g1_i1:71-880(+)